MSRPQRTSSSPHHTPVVVPNPSITASVPPLTAAVDGDYESFLERASVMHLSPPSNNFMNPMFLHPKSRAASLSSRKSYESSLVRSSARSVNSCRTSVSTINGQNRPSSPRRSSWDPSFKSNRYNAPKQVVYSRLQRLNKAPRLMNTPGEAFSKLPEEVLDLIFDELMKLHLESSAAKSTCSTCYMRDMCSSSLTSKKILASARRKLYSKIVLVGTDSPSSIMKRFKIRQGSRLRLLQRTLMANPQLAKLVKVLRVPEMPATATSKKEQNSYLDLVASVVMSCPNLERFADFHIPYNHESSRLTHALSTRENLTEHVWNITAARFQDQKLTVSETQAFISNHTSWIDFHSNWSNLQTLVIHYAPGGTHNLNLITSTILSLPSLKHLTLSALPSLQLDFLEALPSLHSLHLSGIPIVSCTLSSFAGSAAAQSIKSLSLVDTSLTSLPTLARLFSSLTALTHFTLHQDTAPVLPIGIQIETNPYFSSKTLKSLHWDILMPESGDRATHILARSIIADGFPLLGRIRAPSDYYGVLQKTCRPLGGVPHLDTHRTEQPKSAGIVRKDSGIAINESTSCRAYTRSLQASLKALQARIAVSRTRPRFQILVEDWSQPGEPRTIAQLNVGAFLGRLGPGIPRYVIGADLHDSDEALVRVESLLRSGEERDGKTCVGAWNKGRKDSEHKKRRKWKEIETGMLFAI